MIIELLFCLTLNMSLPEFQPQEDLSGNYIVGSYDVSSDEFIVEDISVNDVSLNQEDGLQGELFAEAVNTDDINILDAPLLRSIEVNTVNASVKNGYRISSGTIAVHSGDRLYYVYLTAGIEYTLSTTSGMYTSKGLGKGSIVTVYSNSTITPSENIYLIKENQTFYVTYTTGTPDDEPDVSGDDVSGDEPNVPDVSGDDTSGNNGGNIPADLSGIESKLDNVILLQRSMLMVLLVNFLYPVIMACVNNLKGGKNV